MNKIFKILFSIFTIAALSCNNFNVLKQIDISKICIYLKIKSIELSREEEHDNGTNTANLVATISNSPLFQDSKQKPELIISKTAFLLYLELKKQNIKGFDKIILKVSGSKHGQSYEDKFSFFIPQLQEVDSTTKTVNEFLNEVSENTLNSLGYFHNEFFENNNKDTILKLLNSEFKGTFLTNSSQFLGFGINQNKVALIYSIKLLSGKDSSYNFVFYLNDPNKIIGISRVNLQI